MASSDFLYNLGEIVSNQFSLGENKNASLDIVQNGQAQRFGKLGPFASKFDQSAQRSYTEEGSSRIDRYNPKPKQLDILMQDPDLTVFIKKRAFSSLAENFRPDLMDEKERLFYKATKLLFQNKCKQISNYEKLSKIERISNQIGEVDYNLLPIIFSATDALAAIPGIGSGLTQFKSIIDRVREVVALNQDNFYTTWLTNVPDSFTSTFGEGTGVIELTTVQSISTTTSINFGQGSFNMSIVDPYKLMLITENDIDQAIADANNNIYNNSFVQLGIQSLDEITADRKRQLTLSRIGRGVNPIIFQINPDTYLGKRVRAIIDGIGFEILFNGSITGSNTIDDSAKLGSEALGNQGLNNDEISIFNDIVSNLFVQLSIAANSRRDARSSNMQINDVRNRLRLHYNGKQIIQPMDTIHVYMGSKTKIDNKIVGGLQGVFSGLNFLQGSNAVLQDLKDSFDMLSGSSIEKSIFVGNDFPNWLWLAMRNQFVADKKGAHTFAGIVETTNESYNGGSYTVSVSGTDNAGYFNYGIVNFRPSVDVFNGSLYDPLTPFDLKFDTITGVSKDKVPDLLPENKSVFESAFVKNKSGLLAGIKPTEKNFLNQDAERSQNTSVKRVFYDPDGFVYRWKQGVGTLVLFGDSFTENPIDTQAAPALTEDPFAGQDIMNVLSLLITGEPYNFATFYKAAVNFDSFARDPQTGEDPAFSYYRSLQNSLKYRNLVYGNFVPFKKLTVDEKTFTKTLGNQLSALSFNSDVQQLLEQRATLSDKLIFLTGVKPANLPPGAVPTADVNAISTQLAGLDTQIQQKIQSIQTELSTNKVISIYGNDISFDYDTSTSLSDKTRLDDDARRELRRKINYLTRRLIWKVRANEDVNLLLVDDTYDKDYDIQAFEKSFTNPALFKSDYITVSEKIRTVADILELEVFANTQGHIEVRNPKYNRAPSSVFYKMLRLKDELGIQVFPQFLEDLYATQLDSLFTEIEVLEDEIRLYCLSLNAVDDSACEAFINTSEGSLAAGANLTDAAGQFRFLSQGDQAKVAVEDLRKVVANANPDDIASTVQTTLSSVQGQANVNAFDIGVRATIIQQNVIPSSNSNNPNQFANLNDVFNQQFVVPRKDKIVQRLSDKTGQQFDVSQIFGNTNGLKPSNTVSAVDILKVLNAIATRVSARQHAIKSAANALRNVKESVSLFTSDTNATTNKLLLPSLSSSTSIPQMFEHMIEDESYDDLGPGSAKRYILSNDRIISYTISEKRPRYTAVEVNGRFGDNFIRNSDLPSDLAAFQNGNALITASAVDYDLWRMYGIALPQTVEAPFLTDPNTQCAPYAVSLLNRAKKQILSGTIDIIGNEYQQPGEVVYLEDRNMLFYVESVSHDFTFGRNFTTRLNISYGHSPGEYIPTPLDVIGKVLYKNKDITNYVHKRQSNSFNQEHIGTIVGNISNDILASTSSVEDDITTGSYGESNRAVLQKIFDYAAPILASATDTYVPTLELRVYYNTDDSFPDFNTINAYSQSIATTVKDYLIGANDLHGNAKATGKTNTNTPSLQAFFPTQLVVLPVNAGLTQVGEFRYPSAKAFYYARNALERSSTTIDTTQIQTKIDSIIYGSIVDCWIVFKNTNSS